MTIEELKEKLKEIKKTGGDCEDDHACADKLLLEFIGDVEVTELFNAIEKWYA